MAICSCHSDMQETMVYLLGSSSKNCFQVGYAGLCISGTVNACGDFKVVNSIHFYISVHCVLYQLGAHS